MVGIWLSYRREYVTQYITLHETETRDKGGYNVLAFSTEKRIPWLHLIHETQNNTDNTLRSRATQ